MGMRDIRDCAETAAGLWLVPWTPVLMGILAAWAFGWSVPALAILVFLMGWPVAWYAYLRGSEETDDVHGR